MTKKKKATKKATRKKATARKKTTKKKKKATAKRGTVRKKFKTRKGVGGRKKKIWNAAEWRLFESACRYWGHKNAIGKMMLTDPQTIDRLVKEKHKMSFSELLRKKFGPTRMKLAKKQFDAAMKGNTKLLIHLGKQKMFLDQATRVDVTSGGEPITTSQTELLKQLGDDDLAALEGIYERAAAARGDKG